MQAMLATFHLYRANECADNVHSHHFTCFYYYFIPVGVLKSIVIFSALFRRTTCAEAFSIFHAFSVVDNISAFVTAKTERRHSPRHAHIPVPLSEFPLHVDDTDATYMLG